MSEEQGKLKEIADQFSAAMSQIDQEAERDFINELIEVVTVPPKKVPEPVFREIFLPYFTGEKVPDKDNDALAHWIGLVGSASESADVVNVKGEVLFRVPPLYDTSRLKQVNAGDAGMNFGTIFDVYQDQARVHPNLGKNFLVNELAKKTAATIGNQEVPTGETGWTPIFRHYKLLPEQNTKPSQQNATPGDEDLFFGDD